MRASQKPPARSPWWRRNKHREGLHTRRQEEQLGRRWKWVTETGSQKQSCEEEGGKKAEQPKAGG